MRHDARGRTRETERAVDLAGGTTSGGSGADSLSGIEVVAGSTHNDTFAGSAAADTFYGGAGDDTLAGGGGADTLHGESGNDLFLWQRGEGNDTVSGGAGWTDTITIQANGLGSGNGDWTLNLTSGSVTSSGAGVHDLSADAAGTINFNDGSQIAFDGLEKIQWT